MGYVIGWVLLLGAANGFRLLVKEIVFDFRGRRGDSRPADGPPRPDRWNT